MTKKILATLILLIAVLGTPRISYGKTVCTQEYGQPVVCKEEEEEKVLRAYVPKETGLVENIGIAGISLLIASGALFLRARKEKALSSILGS